jgi:hypothetical protein
MPIPMRDAGSCCALLSGFSGQSFQRSSPTQRVENLRKYLAKLMTDILRNP